MAEAAKRRKAWPFYLGILLVLAMLPVGYFVFLGQEPAPPPPPPPPPPVKHLSELKLDEVSGQVQIRRAGGEWTVAATGETLKSSDAVKTADGAYAVLVGGEAYEVRMEAGTEVAVSELSDSISKLLLESGMATARVKGAAKHTFEVKATGSEARASTRGGEFTISSNGLGTVAVGTRDGVTEFEGGGKVVLVNAGYQSLVVPGKKGPSEPTPIPADLLLSVKVPQGNLEKPIAVIRGHVAPGSRVDVNGHIVKVDQDGEFKHTIKLVDGNNPIITRAVSVGGTSKVSRDKVPWLRGTKVDSDLWK